MDSKPWVLRVLITGPTPIPADWLAGHIAPILAPYFELSSRFTRVEVPITSVNLATEENPENTAVTSGLFNGTTVFDPDTALFFTGFTWVLDEKQPVVITPRGRGVTPPPNDVRRIYASVTNHLETTVFGGSTSRTDFEPSRTGFYANLIVIKRGEPLGPPLAEIPAPPEGRGGGWGWWLAGGTLALLAGWAILRRKQRGKARRLP